MHVPIVNTPPHHTDRFELSLLTPCHNLDDIKLVLAGHSHCTCIFEAMTVSDNAPPAHAIACSNGMAGLRGNRTEDSYWAALRSLAKGRTVALCWYGNQQDHFFFANNGAFDFCCDSRPNDPLLPDAPLVAEEVVRAHFRPSLDRLIEIVGDLRRAGAARIVLLGTPATRGDEDELRRLFAGDPLFTSLAADLGYDGATVPMTSLGVKVKLWAVLQDVMRETAAAHADLFVPSPAATRHADGTLKMDYWLGDGVHGNYDYGCLMVETLAEACAA